ncbi:MAG: hypothetical protein GWN88_12570 [Nitrospinaceae bacterium]|nr:hypothetical protein [Nitrospinaceae bacterium]NIW59674.1 hypothetical protein [Nitrospinaceae bacterium]
MYPLKQAVSQIPLGDSGIHLFGFGLLAYCFFRSWEKEKTRGNLFFSLVALGITLEILQAFMILADFEFEDSLANTAGVMMGYFLVNARKEFNF